MRFEDEQYVRLYKRDTTTWLMLNWQGRCILPLIFRKLDRAGLLDLGEDGYEALAAHIQVPLDVVEEGMTSILRRKALVLREDGLLMAPRFIEAQEAKQSDKARQKASRDRARDLASAAVKGFLPAATVVTHRDDEDPPPSEPSRRAPSIVERTPTPPNQDVTQRDSDVTKRDSTVTSRNETITRGHTTSQGVTLSSAQLSSAEPRNEDPPVAPQGGRGVGSVAPKERWQVPKSETRIARHEWIEAYTTGVVAGSGDDGWSFRPASFGALERVISNRCPPPSRSNIAGWLAGEATRFAEAVRDNPSVWSSFSPDGFERWWNAGCPGAAPTSVLSSASRAFAPDEDTPIAVQPTTPEQRAADAAFLAELAESSTLRAVRQDDAAGIYRPIRIAGVGGGTGS